MRAFAAYCLLALFLDSAIAAGGAIQGTVSDETGGSVLDARVILWRSDQSVVVSTSTSADGRFRFDTVRPGSYSLEVSKSWFSSRRIALSVVEGETTEVWVSLAVQPVTSEVTVTAETSRVASANEVAQQLNVISQSQIEQRFANVLVDVLKEQLGVDVQRTVPVMGGISVRGLLGKNVAVYHDNVRYTTSAQRGGVSTFLNLNDPANLDSVEVLRGPNSAQYSSDSLGGTVHFLSRAAPVGTYTGWHGEFATGHNTVAHGFGGNLLASYSGQRIGLLTNLSGRRANTWRSGGGLDGHAAVTRFLGLPSSVLGDRSTDTAFTQYGGMLHTQWAATPERQVVFHYERSQQDGGKRWDQLLGGDGNLVADLRNLMLDFGYLRYSDFKAGPFDRMAVTLSYNKQREERVNQGGNGNPAGGITHQYERTEVWGTSFFLAKQRRRHHVLLGGDGYREKEVSPAVTVNPVSGATVFSRPRLPDGARYLLYGLYLQDAWEVLKNGRLRLSGALRFGGASYRSRASNSPLVNGLALWPDDSTSTNEWSGRAGLVVRPIDPLHIHFHYSRGFRAPGMTDLGTLGIQGNGFFEASFADLGGRGATVGDRADDRAVSSGRPAARVRSENSDNYDLGFKIATGRVRVEINGFWMNLQDAMVSQTLILPPGAAGQFLGEQQIIRQLPTGAVFVPAATAPVQIRSNLGSAETYGLEHALEVKLTRSLSFSENLTWLYARDRRSGRAPDIEGGTPPLTSNLRLRWAPSAKRYWGEMYSTLADRQDRLSSLALADRRTGATRSRANIAGFFNNGARVRGLVANAVLVPTGETLAQVQDRVLGSANSAPLFTAIPGYALFGIRGGFQVSERSNVLVDFSNMLDQGHRGVSWGVDGAGRSLAVRYGHSF